MKKIGVVGIPGNWSSIKLLDTVAQKTGFKFFIDMEKVFFDMEIGKIRTPEIDLFTLDAIIVKKLGKEYSPNFLNRLSILNYLSNRGMKIYSHPQKISQVLNRLNCTLILSQGGIPIPPTFITENIAEGVNAVRKLKKVVLKPLFSTKARGMVVLDDSGEIKNELIEYQNKGNSLIYIQKFVQIPEKDLGIVFLGGKYLATYARVGNKKSWNTTVFDGGKYEPYEPSKDMIEIAYKAQSLFGLDFTCVDLVETPQGPMVFEVSAFGGFRGLLDGCGIDASELYTNYVLGKVNND